MIQILPRDVFISKRNIEFQDDIAIPESLYSNITEEDIEVYKLLYHPRGSNIFYSLSRTYIYHQKQKKYLNDQLLFTSFGSIGEAFRFVNIFDFGLYPPYKGI